MRIVVDINHPAHVHYFKNFIWVMQEKGHDIFVTASEKDVSYDLLNHYGFDYIPLGNYGSNLIKKLINIPVMDIKLYRKIKKFNPDIFIGFGSIRAAHASKLMRKPCINLDDTEHSIQEHILYVPFTDIIITPACFMKDFGKKHVRYNGYTELAHLHPNYFKPNPEVLKELGLGDGDLFTIVRFVSWDASHDVGQSGIRNKEELVWELEKYGRVLITSERELPEELQKFRINVPPEKLHDLLYYARLYIGEGATMAVESAILGTPSIYVSSLIGTMGNFMELGDKYGLILSYKDSDVALSKAIELIQDPGAKEDWKIKSDQLLRDKIDVTSFMIDFVEAYLMNRGLYEI